MRTMNNFIVKPSAKVYYLKIILCAAVFTILLLILGTILKFEIILIIPGIWFIAIFCAIAAKIMIHFRSIEVTDKDITMKIGVLNTKSVVVPYGQITNVNVKRTLFDRVMGLGLIEVDTPGTDVAELTMDYISKNDIYKIREALRNSKVRVGK